MGGFQCGPALFGRARQIKPDHVDLGSVKDVAGDGVSPPLVNQSRQAGFAHRPPTFGFAWAALNISASALSTLA